MSKIHGGLSDDALLAQTRKLAHLEQQLQVTVIDHLREIHTRRLYLSRGFSSLFDYAVRELSYTDSAASRRINAMHLCAEFEEVREGLQDGSFTLSTAAQLQSAFDRQKRNRQRKGRGPVTGSGSAVPRQESLLAPSAGTAQPPEPAPLLDVSARQALVKQAVGKSTRQVQELLAGVDPELTVPADKMRPVGNGCYEMKVVIDAECHRGLERLRGLLSHVDPHMTLGQLVGRLARKGIDRHDPSRPPRRPRTGSRPASGDRTSAANGEAASGDAPDAAPKTPAQPAAKGSVPARSSARQDGDVTSPPKRSASNSRAIPIAIKRRVWQRDDGRCSYVDPRTGRRCTSRHLLQIDHKIPYALGGSAEPGNLVAVLCPSPASPPGACLTGRGCRVRIGCRSALVDDERVQAGPHGAPTCRTSTKRPVAADSLAASEVYTLFRPQRRSARGGEPSRASVRKSPIRLASPPWCPPSPSSR